MENKKLEQWLKQKDSFYSIASVFAALLMVGALSAMFWVADSPSRTILGKNIRSIEKKISADKKALEGYAALTDQEKAVKAAALKYAKLSFTQNVVIRQLIDLGFLSFVFWSGVYMFGIVSFRKRFTRKFMHMISSGNGS